jgi:hypothetical protein
MPGKEIAYREGQKEQEKGAEKCLQMGNRFDFFSFPLQYSTLLYLPPLTFHCFGKFWDRAQVRYDFGIGCQTL